MIPYICYLSSNVVINFIKCKFFILFALYNITLPFEQLAPVHDNSLTISVDVPLQYITLDTLSIVDFSI
jgi:poly(A) polymerase Pap1